MAQTVAIREVAQGNLHTWCTRDDAPRGGWVLDVLGFSYVAKYQGGAVYPVLCLGLTWYFENAEEARPLLGDLHKALARFGCERADQWEDAGYCHEVWRYRNPYGERDIVRKFTQAARWLGWVEVVTGWWAGPVPDWVEVEA